MNNWVRMNLIITHYWVKARKAFYKGHIGLSIYYLRAMLAYIGKNYIPPSDKDKKSVEYCLYLYKIAENSIREHFGHN